MQTPQPNTSLAPGTPVMRCDTRPPVQLSAVASVLPFSRSTRTSVCSSDGSLCVYTASPSTSQKRCARFSHIARAFSSFSARAVMRTTTSPFLAYSAAVGLSPCKSAATRPSRWLSPTPATRREMECSAPSPSEASHGRTCSRNIGRISPGGPGSSTARRPGFFASSKIMPGAVPLWFRSVRPRTGT